MSVRLRWCNLAIAHSRPHSRIFFHGRIGSRDRAILTTQIWWATMSFRLCRGVAIISKGSPVPSGPWSIMHPWSCGPRHAVAGTEAVGAGSDPRQMWRPCGAHDASAVYSDLGVSVGFLVAGTGNDQPVSSGASHGVTSQPRATVVRSEGRT